MSDAKIVDAQCGLESAGGALLAALAGVNMVSGAGMMDFESCQSPEKLVVDAEIIGMAKRLIAGIELRGRSDRPDLMRKLGHAADYLSEPHTLKWFTKELYFPSEVIDRASLDGWQQRGATSAFDRARSRADHLVAAYRAPARTPELRAELRAVVASAARTFGMAQLPPLPDFDLA